MKSEQPLLQPLLQDRLSVVRSEHQRKKMNIQAMCADSFLTAQPLSSMRCKGKPGSPSLPLQQRFC